MPFGLASPFSTDNIGHIAIMTVIAAVALALGAPPLVAWWAGTAAGLLREATQIQSNQAHDNFFYGKGWQKLFNPWTEHFSEWAYPGLALAPIVWALNLAITAIRTLVVFWIFN